MRITSYSPHRTHQVINRVRRSLMVDEHARACSSSSATQ